MGQPISSIKLAPSNVSFEQGLFCSDWVSDDWSLLSVTSYDLVDLKTKFTEWYYLEGGGIFLTEIDQKMYTNFVREIECLITRSGFFIEEKELEKLRELVSAFRSNLLQSIGTREESQYHN